MKILHYTFKAIAAALFFIFFGGVIFNITHSARLNSDGSELKIVREVKENEEIICNSSSVKSLINEISTVNNVGAASIFEMNGKLLIGIETDNFEPEYESTLKKFLENAAIEYLGVKNENVFIEVNTFFVGDISELSYYASRGLDVNILNSRFNNIYNKLRENAD